MITDVTTPPTTEPVTLDEAKEHLCVTHKDDDALISRLIQAAREEAEHFTRRSIPPQTITGYLDRFDEVDFPFPPLRGVTSIEYVDPDGVLQTLAPSVYTVDLPGRRIYLAYGQSWPSVRAQKNAVKITFEAGYTTVPAKIKQAILLMVGEMYEVREETAERSRSSVYRTAENLLWPYRDLS